MLAAQLALIGFASTFIFPVGINCLNESFP
jgi:hypothetical protein